MTHRPLLTYAEASDYLAVGVKTLQHWVHRREIPFVRVGPTGRLVRFRPDDLDAWVAEQTAAAS